MQTKQNVGLPEAVRSSLVRNLVLLVLVTSGAIAGVFFYASYRAVDDLSRAAISNTTDRTHVELERFFGPVERNLRVAATWSEATEIDLDDPAELNKRFIPLLRQNPQVTSMLLADTTGREYLLLKDGDDWVNRLTNKTRDGKLSRWKKWTSNGRLLESWDKQLDYDPRSRPWYQGAIASERETIFWTDPYVFFTTKDPGITASTRFVHRTSLAQYVIAFDVMLQDISAFTTQFAASEHGYAAVVGSDGRVLGLPHDNQGTFDQPEARKQSVLKPAVELDGFAISTAIDVHKTLQTDTAFHFSFNGDRWWGGIRPYPLGTKTLSIVVMVPNSDYVRSIKEQQQLILIITLLALVLAFILGATTLRSFRSRVDEIMRGSKQLGQYTIESKLGSGGMGDVYRARHAMLRRPTAVKLLKPDSVNDFSIERFEREVQMTCRLTHPNTITIYDYGHTPDGLFYYAMEYLSGRTLLDFINIHGPIGAGRTIFILRQVCESLREAHEIGLIHRDIKPGNIFLTTRGGNYDVVKVLDFGLVKELESDVSITQAEGGLMTGTPGYMAPEAIHTPEDANARSDIYAVGAVAFAMLTGVAAYQGTTGFAVFMKQLNQDPPDISGLADVPDDLAAIVMQCLSREPSDRPESIDALLVALNSCANARDWSKASAQDWWLQHLELLEPKSGDADLSSFDITIDMASRDFDVQMARALRAKQV